MKNKFIIITFFLLTYLCKGQTWPWAVGMLTDVTAYDECYGMSIDKNDNVYITGGIGCPSYTFGAVTFTTGPGIFISKIDANGNVIWVKSTTAGTGADSGASLTNDASGNTYLTGSFYGPNVIFDTYTLTGNTDIFLTKYDPNGNVLWAKSAIGSGTDYATSISKDGLGSIYVTGYFNSSNLTIDTYTLTNIGGSGSDVFLAKFDLNGNAIWAKNFGGIYGDIANSISTDINGNSYITGSFTSPTLAIGTTTLLNTGAAGNTNIFFTKFDINGNVVWAKSFGGNAIDNGYGVCVDGLTNVYLTGSFSGSSTSIGTNTLSSNGGQDAFISKFDSNGNSIWSKSIGDIGTEQGYSVSSKINGVYLSGGFYQSPSLTIGATTYTVSNAFTGDPMFIALYDSNGNLECSSILSSGGDDINIILSDSNGDAYLAGDYYNVNPFVVGTTSLTLTGVENNFVAKYVPCTTVSTKEIEPNKNQYTIYPNPNNGQFYLRYESEFDKNEIIVFNSLGQKILTQNINNGLNEILIDKLNKGLYQFIIIQNKQKTAVGKFIVE